MLAIILFLIILLVAFGVGARLLRLLGLFRPPTRPKARPHSLAEEFIFAIPLGLGAMAYAVLLLGLLKVLYAWALAILVLAAGALVYKEIIRLWAGFAAGFSKSLKTTFPYSSLPMGIFLVLICPPLVIGTLAPAAGLEWDGLAYHLAVPKIYLQNHQIFALPWMSHSNFPFVTEMLYTLGLALQGQALAKLIHFAFLFILAVAVYCWGNAAFGRGTGILAAAILVSVPLVFWEATVAYNELPFALFCLLALWAWTKRDSEDTAKNWVALSGLFAGLALGTKMLAGFLIVFMPIAILWARRTTPQTQTTEEASPSAAPSRYAFLGLWLLCAGLVALPWYLRSYIWTGNPVYPFFYEIFDGRYWSQALADEYSIAQAKFGLGHSLEWLLALPWTVTMYGRFFYDQPEPPRVFNIFVSVIGPLFLAFLPAAIYLAFKERTARFLLGYCAVVAVAWFFLSAQTNRYLLPLVPALSMVCAGALVRLARLGRAFIIAPAAALGLQMLLALVVCIVLISQPAPQVLGVISEDEYLSKSLDIYPVIREANSRLPQDAKILMQNDTRGFYLDRDYMWGIGHHNLITPQDVASAEALAASFERLDLTHIIISPDVRKSLVTGQDPLSTSLREMLAAGRLTYIFDDNQNGYVLAEISAGN